MGQIGGAWRGFSFSVVPVDVLPLGVFCLIFSSLHDPLAFAPFRLFPAPPAVGWDRIAALIPSSAIPPLSPGPLRYARVASPIPYPPIPPKARTRAVFPSRINPKNVFFNTPCHAISLTSLGNVVMLVH